MAARGIDRDSVVVVGLRNLPEHIAVTHAAWKLGALVLPVGCGLAMIAGVTLLFSAHPACANCEINQFDLTHEVDR
jgi:acyl-coenzyme A synthetase/AMP-(fatty) acid ligase